MLFKILLKILNIFFQKKKKTADGSQEQTAEADQPQSAAEKKRNRKKNAQSAGLKQHKKPEYGNACCKPEENILHGSCHTAVRQQSSEKPEEIIESGGADPAAEECQE